MLEKRYSVKTKDGIELSGILSTPQDGGPYPLIISCHGFGSGKNNKTNGMLKSKLNDVGIALLRFDFRGHYDSSGEIEDITISNAVIDIEAISSFAQTLEQIDDTRIGIFSSSFGSSAAIIYNANHAFIRAHVMKAPITDYVEVRTNQLGPEGIKNWEKMGFTLIPSSQGEIRSNFAFYKDASNLNLLSLAEKINSKCLIFHNVDDDNSPVKQSILLNDKISNCEIVIQDKGGHGFNEPNQLDRLVATAVDFYKNSF